MDKILSDGIEVAGTHNSLQATFAITGNCSWFDLHHNNAHSSWCSCGSLLNCSSSAFPNLSSSVEHVVELVEVLNKNYNSCFLLIFLLFGFGSSVPSLIDLVVISASQLSSIIAIFSNKTFLSSTLSSLFIKSKSLYTTAAARIAMFSGSKKSNFLVVTSQFL